MGLILLGQDYITQVLKRKNVLRIVRVLAVVFLVLLILESGLNFWVRSGLRRSLLSNPGPDYQIQFKVGWLGLGDLLAGRVNRVRVNAKNCSLNELRYSKLVIDSQGFSFNLRAFLKEKRLEITELKKTRISGVVGEQALSDYLNLRYPQYQSAIRIKPGGLELSGTAHILNQIIPVKLEGNLKAISGKRLRFYPTRLIIANSKVSGSLLRIVSEQAPLEFGIMEDWPLKISDFKLEEKRIKISMEESKT